MASARVAGVMLVTLTLFASAGNGQEVVLNFDNISPTASRISHYTQDSFRLSASDGFWLSSPGTGGGSVWYPYENPYYLGLNALDAAGIHNPDPTITLVNKDGTSAFNLLSIDLAPETNTEPVHPAISFIGTHADGTQTIDTVTITTTDSFEHFALTELTNIVSLTWEQGPWYSQFTNVTVESVPEPSSLTMTIISALVGIAMAAKHRLSARR